MKIKTVFFGILLLIQSLFILAQNHKVGNELHGGIIVFTDGEHGLIISKTNIGDKCSYDDAVLKCKEYSTEKSYVSASQWYLPSIGELTLIKSYHEKLGKYKLDEEPYWSSTVKNKESAWAFLFNIVASLTPKHIKYRVRAVRAF